jgi:hypothetical protein
VSETAQQPVTNSYSYRQPAVGQSFVDLIEGHHAKYLTLDKFAGRYVVICCFGSRRIGPGEAAIKSVIDNADQFDDVKKSFLGVSIDPSDKVATSNGVHYFLDRDGILSRHCGASPIEDVPLGTQYRVTWTILDPSLHVLAHFHTGPDPADCEKVFALVRGLPASDGFEACEIPAPILVLPRVFDPAFCDRLAALYDAQQARDSGFMRDNVEIFDYSFKRRRDYFIEDDEIKKTISKRISLCVIPEIRKLFFMKVTRMERYLIGCYAADEQAHFKPHRDNGQPVTAHRRFALSVALNEDFSGGELVFPEYSQRPYKIPKGWSIVFPCAILHAVTPVTSGQRYVFLPFLYDELGARMKDELAKNP